jgi:hypothetical protein
MRLIKKLKRAAGRAVRAAFKALFQRRWLQVALGSALGLTAFGVYSGRVSLPAFTKPATAYRLVVLAPTLGGLQPAEDLLVTNVRRPGDGSICFDVVSGGGPSGCIQTAHYFLIQQGE